MGVVLDHLGEYADGIRVTVALTLAAFTLAMVLGTVIAACRVSPVPPLRAAGAFYVETVRNTPLAVLFVLVYFGLPKVGLKYSTFVTAVVVLGGYTGAFIGEAVRAGINTVATGQAEAARAIGLTFPQVLRIVVLPQAFRAVVAPLGNLFIACAKNSSVASIIALHDLSFVADELNTATAQPIAVFMGAAVAYFLLTFPSGLLVGYLERRVAIKR